MALADMLNAAITASALGCGRNCRSSWKDVRDKALSEPKPELFFVGFGDSSLNFELAVWSAEMAVAPRRFRSEPRAHRCSAGAAGR